MKIQKIAAALVALLLLLSSPLLPADVGSWPPVPAEEEISTLQGEMTAVEGDVSTLQGEMTAVEGVTDGLQPARVFTVSPSGAGYTGIEAAVAAAGAVATSSSRATVEVGPGTYAETCPVPVPQYVTVVARGGHEAVIMTCGAGVHGFVFASDSSVVGVQVEGVGSGGFAAFQWPAAVEHAHAVDTRVVDFDIGWLSESTGEGNTVDASGIYSGTTTSGTKAGAGMLLRVHNFYVAPSATIVNVFHADGAAALMFVQGAAVYSTTVTNCVHADNGAVMRVAGSGCSTVVNGIRIGLDSEVLLVGGGVDAASGYDAVLETSTSELYLGGCWMQKDKIGGTDTGILVGCATSDTPGDQGQWCYGEFHVGDRRAGSETCLGGGDSYFADTIAFLNDNLAVGSWTDVTAESKSSSGSTFTPFPGKSVGECLYLGSPYAFPGLKVNVTTALVPGAGELLLTYWDGSWAEVDHMATEADAPYAQYGDTIYERTGSEQIRFAKDGMPGWVKSTLNGENQYWVRLCVITGAIATAPVIEQHKFHTDRAEFNADGLWEAFGAARPSRSLTVELYPISGNDPDDENITISGNLTLGQLDNAFDNGKTDAIGGVITIPEGLDTSTPIVLSVPWHSKTVTSGSVEWELLTVAIPAGSILDGSSLDSTEESQATIVGVPGSAEQLTETSFDIYVAELVAGERIAFKFFRDATGPPGGNSTDDDAAGDMVTVRPYSVTGTFWR